MPEARFLGFPQRRDVTERVKLQILKIAKCEKTSLNEVLTPSHSWNERRKLSLCFQCNLRSWKQTIKRKPQLQKERKKNMPKTKNTQNYSMKRRISKSLGCFQSSALFNVVSSMTIHINVLFLEETGNADASPYSAQKHC